MKQLSHPSLFSSEQSLRAAFERGLGQLLDVGGLNHFILALANASLAAPRLAGLRDRFAHAVPDAR